MKIAVLANGGWNPCWGKKELAAVDYLICADGGANAALAVQRLPDVLIGDLDSVSRETLSLCRQNQVEIIQYPSEKDETDLELALQWAEQKIRKAALPDQRWEILLYGALGGRTDHLLGNLSLVLASARRGVYVRLKDPGQELWVVQGGDRLEIEGKPGQLISLLPCGEPACVSTEGLVYALHHEELLPERVRGISNIMAAEKCVIEVHRGRVWAIQNILE
ncbi:MAG: thiamine diphosphokinase [Peptococcaceae bacterium]|nr:thiamine diphosphokinase [Peptococcaceae bacterium]